MVGKEWLGKIIVIFGYLRSPDLTGDLQRVSWTVADVSNTGGPPCFDIRC